MIECENIGSGDDNPEQSDLTSENVEPIHILVYPPKNKKFRVDEQTNTIQIEPVTSQLSMEDNAKMSIIEAEGMTEPLGTNECQLSGDEKNLNGIAECNEIVDVGIKGVTLSELFKIESTFTGRDCFLKGCKWSPDGFCLLSNSEDNALRLFEIPESTTNLCTKDVSPVLAVKEGGTIYDYLWYPKMSSCDPVSCVFASTSQNAPIHLWDAYTGCLRATYQPYNQYDEVTAAYSLAFSPDGCKIYSGFKKFLRIFDISLPGRVCDERNLKPKGDLVFQTNITSCITINPVMPNIYALGSYDRTIGIYTEPEGELQCILKGHKGGVTHIMFSRDGIRLYSGGRKDSEIICWDLRTPGKILFVLKRVVDTNQRIYFDLSPSDSYLATGSTDGRIIMYDTKKSNVKNDTCLEPVLEWTAHEDCANGVSFHPFRDVLATSSGQHHLPRSSTDGEDDDSDVHSIENTVKIWSLNCNNLQK